MSNPLYDKLFGVHLENDDPFLYLLDGQIITYRQFLGQTGKTRNTPGTILILKFTGTTETMTGQHQA